MPACRVLIVCSPERQSFNSGLDIAQILVALGHHVVFLSVNSPEMRKHVEANGFEYCGIGPDYELLLQRLERASFVQRSGIIRSAIPELNEAMQAFASCNAGSYQIVLMDVLAGSVVTHALAKAGFPTILFCSGYTGKFSLRYPPASWCARTPSRPNGKTEKLANLLHWTKTALICGISQALVGFRVAGLGFPYVVAVDWRQRRQARRYGWRFCIGDWGVRPLLPEIACAYKPLDWPAQQKSDARLYLNRHHFRRDATDKSWHMGIDSSKPLIYCSLGAVVGSRPIWKDSQQRTVLSHVRVPLQRLTVVARAFASRPDLQLLIAAGHLADGIDPATVPKNAKICRWVPQDDVLSRSALAITAGGSATVRDCIRYGVPMLIFPMWSDHLGNAARVAHHNLGLNGGGVHKLTAARLLTLIETVMRDKYIAASVSAAKQQYAADLVTEARDLRRFVETHTSVIL